MNELGERMNGAEGGDLDRSTKAEEVTPSTEEYLFAD